MQNPMAFEVQYGEYQRQAAWINANDWQYEKPEQRYRVRKAIAQALITLANLLTPTEKQETRTA
jgi:surface antigen